MSDWEKLKRFTQARIGLERAGHSLSTKEHLQFQLDHARARDAVHWPWEIKKFRESLKTQDIRSQILRTEARSRSEYLTRPDLGRFLQASNLKKLKPGKVDVAIVISNGLSSLAVDNHALPFLKKIWTELKALNYQLAPVALVENARVALSDEIGSRLKAKIVLMILGERPGLSSFDSLALYLTYGPKPGNTDAGRNCISNIRPPEGLSYQTAAEKTLFLVNESVRRKKHKCSDSLRNRSICISIDLINVF